MDFGALVEDDWNPQALGDEEEEEDTEKKDVAKALGMKLPKEDNEKNKQKNNEWEEASKISAADTKADILDKVMKFKAEIEKDKSQLETKEYEAKKAGLKDSQLYKDCKEVKSKLEAFNFIVSHLLMWTARVLCSCIGLDSPKCCMASYFLVGQGSLTKLVALLKKSSLAKSECGTVMPQALQALQAAKPLKTRFLKAMKAG